MHDGLQGAVALVTGGTAGIGLAVAEVLVRSGGAVVIAGRDRARGEAALEALAAAGPGSAEFAALDVRSEADVAAAVDRVLARHGRLDVAVNSAGIGVPTGPTVACAEAAFLETIDVNLTGVWRSMKHELRAMAGRGGSIVNVSGVFGLVGRPGLPAYVAAKHGVVGLTKAAALEHAADGIRVNAVCPGVTRTPMIAGLDEGTRATLASAMPMGRLAEPVEIARVVAFLCSPDSSFVTGQALAADGGWVAG